MVAAHLLEGHVVLMVDNSPSAMLFPATLFHFTQHSEDYYQNPLVGTYIRWIRFFAILDQSLVYPSLASVSAKSGFRAIDPTVYDSNRICGDSALLSNSFW